MTGCLYLIIHTQEITNHNNIFLKWQKLPVIIISWFWGIHTPVWLRKYFHSCLQTMKKNFKEGEVQQLCNLTFQLHCAYLGCLNSPTNYITRDKLIVMDDHLLRLPPLKKRNCEPATCRKMQKTYCFVEILQISTLIPASLIEESDWKLCTTKENRISNSRSTNQFKSYIQCALVLKNTTKTEEILTSGFASSIRRMY